VRYVSTRGSAPTLAFDEALLTGLARDGGLYVPAQWPEFSEATWRDLRGARYAEIALKIMAPFVGNAIARDTLESIVEQTYRGFNHTAVAPLKQIGSNDWLLELFHGPTLAFKDYALQLLGRLFDHVLAAQGKRAAILGATSGDTGSAAIEACRDRAALDIFILFPHGRVSEFQRRQMTTVMAGNVHAIAIDGTFDDAQAIVKSLFNDLSFRDEVSLAAINSINWARIMAQIVYYATAALSLGAPDRPVSFAVPTGNFGNIYAGYAAKRMGLPIDRLVMGSNRNDILTRFMETGTMSVGTVEPSISPSMDIQVSSNFERLLFELLGRDGAAVTALMAEFQRTGAMSLGANVMAEARALISAARVDDETTRAVIARVHKATGEILDPHTAIGVEAARLRRGDTRVPMISLACAHPAKFADAVRSALGVEAPIPDRLKPMMTADERVTRLPATADAVRNFMIERLSARSGRKGETA
jgi:threonine synthase